MITPKTSIREGKMAAKKDNLLRSKDVAHILNLPPDDVIYLARKGKLRGIKEGKYWKFRLRDVKFYQQRATKE
jgi:Helix-turn-helix domain